VSYLAVDALEGALVKGDDRIARVWAHRARLEKLASKKWDNGEYEDGSTWVWPSNNQWRRGTQGAILRAGRLKP
jgi:hypothetical protein